MAGLIWNGRGARRKGFVAFLKDTIMEYNVEFMGIQETMLKFYSKIVF
jgi:hypothetical protein